MPFILRDPEQTKASSNKDLREVSYEYEYPEDLDLKPGSDLHDKLRDRIMERANASFGVMQRRFSSWNKIDNILTAYMPTDTAEDLLKEKDSRKPVSIVVPYSYATMETILTYMITSFLNDPIFQFTGRGPEDTIGAALLEKVIAQHCDRAKVGLALHTLFRDCLAYGIGIAVPSWETRYGYKTVKRDTSFFGMLGSLVKGNTIKEQVETVLFEGNKLDNIDPYKFLPDPNVPIHKIQEGEYVGWVSETNYMAILGREADDGSVFNAKYLKHIDGRSNLFWNDESNREKKFAGRGDKRSLTDVTRPIDLISMYVTIVPKEWGLGDSEYPEKWYFALAGDEVIIEARPLGLNHNMYPVVTAAPDFDGYSLTPISRLELTYGMQETLDWLFSSHIANVRKAINDMLIVDPYLVNINDLKDPEPGKLIRMRRAGWGRGVENAVKQLNVNDVTKGHIQDSSYIIEIMNRVTAASDQSQGFMRTGSAEVSATEARGTQTGYLSRLERITRVVGMQAMQDIAYMFASHTQQLMEEDTYVKVTGEWQDQLMAEYGRDSTQVPVTPFDLLVDYDVVIKDGSMPSANNGDLWIQLYQLLTTNPMIGQQFDLVRIFKHIATSLGAKNVNDFVMQGGNIMPTTLPDDMVESEAAAGNLVPIRQDGL